MAREIKIEIKGDASGFNRALRDAEGNTTRFSGTVESRFGGIIKKAGLAAAAIGAIGTAFIGRELFSAVGAASDLGETTSKVGQIFGDASGQVEAFAAGAATQFGLSKQEAMDAAATFGVFGKAAGKTGGDLAGFSTDLAGLASDLASFGNTTTEEAIESIGAALRGESEPIRKYGILLDDATLRQEALKLGIIETTKEALTPAQKVLAAQAAIYAQTGDMQGDFARTSGGLANQQRILKASVDNLKVSLGERLLPVMTGLVTWLNTTMIPVLEDHLIPAFDKVIEVVGGAVAAFTDGWTGSDQEWGGWAEKVVRIGQIARAAFDGIREAIGRVAQFIKDEGPGILQWFKDWAPLIGLVLGVAGALLIAYKTIKLFETLRATAAIVSTVVQSLGALGPIGLAILAIGTAFFLAYKYITPFRDAVDKAKDKLVEFAREVKAVFDEEGFAAAAKFAGSKIWEGIKAGFDYVVDHAPEWWGAFVDWFTGSALPWAGEQALALAKLMGEWVKDAAKYLAANLPGWLANLADWWFTDVWPWALERLAELGKAFYEWVKDSAAKLRQNLPIWLEDFIAWWIGEAYPAILRAMADGAREMAVWVKDAASKLRAELPGWLREFAQWWLTQALPTMLNFGVTAGKELVAGIFKEMNRAILDLGKFAFDIGQAIVNGIIRGITSLGSKLRDTINSAIVDKIPAWIRGPLGISSPSKVTMEIGRQIVEGLRVGVETSGSGLEQATASVIAGGVLAPATAAVGEAQAERGPSFVPIGRQEIVVQLDGKTLARALVPAQRQIVRAAG